MLIYMCYYQVYISPINSYYHTIILYYIIQVGETPLDRASTKGHLEVALLLLDRGADPNAKDEVSTCYTNIYMIIYAYLYVLLPGIYIPYKLLLSYYYIILYYIIQDDVTPLHKASENGHLEVSLLLLDRGADPHAKNEVSTCYTNIYILYMLIHMCYYQVYISPINSYYHTIIL